MDCSEVLEHLDEYLAATCSRELAGAIESHLVQCRDCRFEADLLKRTSGLQQKSGCSSRGRVDAGPCQSPEQCLTKALDLLRKEYGRHAFYQERDLVWVLQGLMKRLCPERHRIFNDFPIRRATRRSLSADLAIVDDTGRPRLVAEFKYEPDHRRGRPDGDIWPTKLNPSVVFWGAEGVGGDIDRVRGFVADGLVDVAYSIFVDEGGCFRHRTPPTGSRWEEWLDRDGHGSPICVLMSRFSQE